MRFKKKIYFILLIMTLGYMVGHLKIHIERGDNNLLMTLVPKVKKKKFSYTYPLKLRRLLLNFDWLVY